MRTVYLQLLDLLQKAAALLESTSKKADGDGNVQIDSAEFTNTAQGLHYAKRQLKKDLKKLSDD